MQFLNVAVDLVEAPEPDVMETSGFMISILLQIRVDNRVHFVPLCRGRASKNFLYLLSLVNLFPGGNLFLIVR